MSGVHRRVEAMAGGVDAFDNARPVEAGPAVVAVNGIRKVDRDANLAVLEFELWVFGIRHGGAKNDTCFICLQKKAMR